ncbi:MAG: hypothetical protein LBP59_03830 [Planctomycetaceae bacterium]|jgi:hypothetical protein|nr:hypothetical protein [Planctomycetaceae bacterium]
MIEFFDNRLNPLLVRDLRQFVRSRFIVVLINLYVVALVIACLVVLVFTPLSDSMTQGKNLLAALSYISFLTCFFAVVIRTAWSSASEKANEDLMLFTGMTPSTIVFGKILSGITCSLIILTTTIPFVTVAYMLRGVEPKTTIILFIEIFLFIQALNCLAVFSAASSKTKNAVVHTLFTVCLIFLLTHNIIIPLILQATYIISPHAISIFLQYLLITIEISALITCGAIVSLSPPNSNSLLPMRILLTTLFLINTIITIAATGQTSYYYFIAGITCLILCITTLTTTREPEQWSIRIRQNLPKSIFKRIIIFPFYTGASCGVAWNIMMIALVAIIEITLHNTPENTLFNIYYEDNNIKMPLITGILAFTFNYAITAMLIRSWLLKKLSPKYTILIAFGLLLTFSLGSLLLYLLLASNLDNLNPLNDNFINLLVAYTQNPLSALNPFCDVTTIHYNIRPHFQNLRIAGIIIWLIILIPFLVKWYAKQIKNFNKNIEEIRN